MVEITDEGSAREWLSGQPQNVQVALAARCSLRSLPGIASEDSESLETLALQVFRASLTAAVASSPSNHSMSATADTAARMALAARNAVNHTEIGLARSAANSAIFAAVAAYSHRDQARPSFISAARSVKHSAFAVGGSVALFTTGLRPRNPEEAGMYYTYSRASQDVERLELGSPEEVFLHPLWTDQPRHIEGLATAYNRLNAFWETDFRAWGFWQRWYEGMLIGQPLEWDLQEAVALIPDEDWEKGAAHVAEKIREIESRFDLKKRIAELETELATSSAPRLGLGGNNPPEPIQDSPSIAQELIIVWQPLQELKEEAEAETPNPSRIAKAIEALIWALRKGAEWCASKADLIVDTAIKWAIPAGFGYLSLNPDKLEAVIESARRFLSLMQ